MQTAQPHPGKSLRLRTGAQKRSGRRPTMDEWDGNRSLQPDSPGFERDASHRGSKSRDRTARGREMRKDKLDNALDLGLEKTFPASDPVSATSRRRACMTSMTGRSGDRR